MYMTLYNVLYVVQYCTVLTVQHVYNVMTLYQYYVCTVVQPYAGTVAVHVLADGVNAGRPAPACTWATPMASIST